MKLDNFSVGQVVHQKNWLKEDRAEILFKGQDKAFIRNQKGVEGNWTL